MLAFGCGGRDAYKCTSSDQCVGNGAAGVCEPSGFCSFPDQSCPGGRKYEEHAGGGLANTCVTVDAGEMPVESCIASVAYGRMFGCVLKKDGTVWCAGANQRGQIGFGLAGAANILDWMQVRDGMTSMPITDATAIGGGWEHACVVRAGGALWCWGRGDNGQLGYNTAQDRGAAVAVLKETDNMPLTGIVEVEGGQQHTCARDTAGAVWCFGGNNVNQIGDTTTTQRLRAVQVTTGADALTVGRQTSCIHKTNDELWCWGYNINGEVGDGTKTNKPAPTMVGSGKAIAMGSFGSCQLANGGVKCVGDPWRSRLGIGALNTDGDLTVPADVLAAPGGPALANVVELAVGGLPCARLVDGTVKCWTDNVHGQSGTGAASQFAQTVRRADGMPLADAEKLYINFSHACVRRKNGELWCWGRSQNGEYGDKKLEDRAAAAPLVFPCP